MLFSTDHQNYFYKWGLEAAYKNMETLSSYLYWSVLDEQKVVLKIYKPISDEADSVKLLGHYNGHGAVQVLRNCDEACVLELVGDGFELVELTRRGDDLAATREFCSVVKRLHAAPAIDIGLRPIDGFLADFDGYLAQEDVAERELVQRVREIFIRLCAEQQKKVNLHGDLHHYNMMQDASGEWVAIDPKGLWGEREYEIGRYMLNPLPDEYENIDVEARYEIVEAELGYDMQRVRGWAICQAVLASIWGDDKMEFGNRFVDMFENQR